MTDNKTNISLNKEIFASWVPDQPIEAKLSVHGHLGHSAPISALRTRGVDALRAFSGNFSFVYHDKHGLLAARSKTSKFPLYLSTDTHTIASERHRLGTERPVNDARIAHALVGTTPAEMTYLKGVSRIAPGTWVQVSASGVSKGRWAPTLGDLVEGEPLLSIEESPKALLSALTRAVRTALTGSDHAVTANSGGLDSSTLTMLANAIQPTDHMTLLFQTEEADERSFSKIVSAAVQGHNHGVDYPSRRTTQDWRGTARPWLGANIDLQATLMGHCATLGADTLILGSGGDFVTSHGYELLATYSPLQAFTHINKLASRGFGTRAELLQRWVLRPRLPAWLLHLNRRRRGDVSRILPSWINPDFASAHDLQLRLTDAWDSWSNPTHRTTLNDPFHTTLVDDLIEIGRTFGVNVHLPFFDEDVIRTALLAPPAAHLSDGWTRNLLRQATVDVLPEEVRTRTTKATFSTLFHMMNRADADLFRQHVNHPHLAQWIDVATVKSLTDRYLSGEDRCWRGPHFAAQMGRWLTAKTTT